MAKEFMIAGNWKMFKTVGESREFVENLSGQFTAAAGLIVAVFPPLPPWPPCAAWTRRSGSAPRTCFTRKRGPLPAKYRR